MAFGGWDPIRDLLIQQHLDRFQRIDRFAPAPSGWTPPVDLHETEDQYVLTAELAGLQREDIRIEAHEGCITLSGSRHKRPIACEQYHRIERGHGEFSRTFQLPHPVDETHITADLKDGVLTVTVPKSREAAARRIDIS